MGSLAEKYGIDDSHAHKTACPRCRKNGRDRTGNNLHVYGPGLGAFCWLCSFTIPSDERMQEMGWDTEQEQEDYQEMGQRERLTAEQQEHVKEITGLAGKNYRGIRDETSRWFGVRYEYDCSSGEPTAQYFPTTIDSELVGYRIRVFPKDFTQSIGLVGKEVEMLGEFRFKNHHRTVLIVGGETKLLNSYQMLKDDIARKGKDYEVPAVVASTLGEPGAWKQVQSRYEFFSQFEKIIVCMDADEAGKEAAEKIAKVLPKGKVYIMSMRYKDADDYVVDKEGNPVGKEREWIQDYWNAKPWTPDGIVGSGDMAKRRREAASAPKLPLPPFMHRLQKKMAGGIPLKSIVNLGSASGTGKSTIVDECTFFWIFNSPYKPGIVSLESDSGQYSTKLLSRAVGRKIDLIETPEEKLAFLDSPEVLAAERHLDFTETGEQRYFVIEDRDGGLDSMKAKVEQLIIACGCQLIIIDPLQDILDGMSADDQAVFLRWLKGMTKSHDVIFILVNHIRKSSGGKQANSTGADIFEEDMQGSSSIFKSGACNLLFTRNKEAEDDIERNTTRMKASKIRWTGQTGVAGEYYYHNETHTMYDLQDWLEANGIKEY